MTILIVGGAAQGKTAFAQRVTGQAKIIDDLQQRVRAVLQTGAPLPKAEDFWDCTVVCREVGCGVVPMDAQEREWREAVGRLCCDIAAHADRVYRMCCGIPQCIKGDV